MKKIYKTFSASIGYGNLNDDVATFAKQNGYVEINRSAPSLSAASQCGDFAIAVTSIFSPDVIEQERFFQTFSVSIETGDLDDEIMYYAKKNGYIEIERSAPAIAGASQCGDFGLAVTSTFIKTNS
ncbi:MAG: hypothetical protein IJH12_06800 [Clostridia bacterium]|nr:hypothetical protein [Clostridia bacterium]